MSWQLVPASSRRRVGRGLVLFGVAGLVLIGLAAALTFSALRAVDEAMGSLDGQRARVVILLAGTEATLRRAADSAANAGTSLDASARSARDAADLTAQLAGAMEGMAAAAEVEILGIRPFAPLAGELRGVAGRSRTLAVDLTTTAGALEANVGDSAATAADFRALATELATLRRELGAGSADQQPSTGGTDAAGVVGLAGMVLLGLLAWLAILAGAASWAGWRLLRG